MAGYPQINFTLNCPILRFTILASERPFFNPRRFGRIGRFGEICCETAAKLLRNVRFCFLGENDLEMVYTQRRIFASKSALPYMQRITGNLLQVIRYK